MGRRTSKWMGKCYMGIDYRTYHIAKLYYVDGYKQNEIAEMLHISTMLVSRILKKAEAEQVVTIQVHAPNNLDVETAGTLRKKYAGLREAVVVRLESGGDPHQQIGQAAAQYVGNLLHDGCTLGVSWGKTLYAFVSALQPAPCDNMRVLQLSGGFLFDSNYLMMPSNLVQLASERLRCGAVFLNSPMFVASEEMRDMLVQEPSIHHALQLSTQSEINVMGASCLGTRSTMSKVAIVDDADIEELRSLGVIGDVMGEFIDEDGNVIEWSKSGKYIGASVAALDPQAYNICIGGEEDKAQVMDLALRKGFVNTLVVSQALGRRMLALG